VNFWQDAIRERKDRKTLLSDTHASPTDEMMVETYLSGLPISDVARECHIDRRAVREALRRNNIKIRRGRKDGTDDRTLMNNPDRCPQLVRLMEICCSRRNNCPIADKCRMWYDGRVGADQPRECGVLIREFLRMRNENKN